ncbi:MAG: TonB-dependent receptor domain-containing protein [Dysgonomonas sp.]
MPVYSAPAQNATGKIIGRVINSRNQPIYPANVYIDKTTLGTNNDENGYFILNNVPAGNHVLVISGVGLKTVKKNIVVQSDRNNNISDIVVDEVNELSEVTITGKSEIRKQQEQAFAVSVLDISKSYNSMSDLALLINRVAGVRIREDGGVGSGYNFTLNGFSGKQVKFFLDGISMDNFGASFGLNNLPSNMVERVEVYKGVLPVSLGADALGGAVNIVTRKNPNYLDLSYSFGSFNTHKASVNGAFTDSKTGITARLTTFLNYSDNDYKVYVPIIDWTTNEKKGNQWVKRFHDGYKSIGARFETGLVDKPYADYLLAGLIVSGNDKDIQNGAVMDEVYGARTSDSKSVIPSLRYKKTDLFTDGLGISFYGAYNYVDYNSIDTVARRYNWLGEWVNTSPGSGERKRSQLNRITKEWLTNTTIDYTMNSYHTITLNHAFSSIKRKVSDVEDPVNEYNKIPQSIDKHVLGLGWMTKYDRWSATAFGKMYYMKGKTYEVNQYSEPNLQKITKDYTKYGFGTALTYFILPKLQAKFSYEHTYRLPEAFEMFGDDQENSRNPSLKPESSHNFNLGIMYEVEFLKHNTLQVETNLLLRNSKDFIHRELRQQQYMMYVNLGKVKTTGVEANVKYLWKNMLRVGANFTYQNIVDNRKKAPSPTIGKPEEENYNYKDKLPNIPYIFGNFNLGFSKRNLFIKDTELTVDYFLNYVKEYYLSWSSYGEKDSKAEIPKQLSHDISVGYSLQNGRYNVSLECNNLTNEELYDNYKLQKPGRSFGIKLRYYISK